MKPTVKTMRDRIAQATTIIRLDGKIHPENVGHETPITKHQKNALRIEHDGKPFWVATDIIEPLDDDTFATICTPNGPWPGETLAIYRIDRPAHAYGDCCTGHTACGETIMKGETVIASDANVGCRECRAVFGA